MPLKAPLQKLEHRDKSIGTVDFQYPLHDESLFSIADDRENSILDRFTRSLEKVLTLLPDEAHVHDLISPIEGTGERKIREVGIRFRAYKTLLDAWESLHLVQAKDQLLVRDDVLQTLRRHPEIAHRLGMDHIHLTHTYEAYRYCLAQLSMLLLPWTAPYFADHTTLHTQFWNAGRGIVFTAGDKQAPYLLTSIQSIRNLGSDLPIEVMYLGNDDLGEDYREELESIPGVITRDLSLMVNDNGWKLRGWAAKPFAILLSSFREAIFIDADSLFVEDPTQLFLDQSYRRTGALFFKDRLFMPQSKKAWLRRILPTPISKQARKSRLWTGESGHMQESGVVVVDKWRHFCALLMVTRMNGPDRDGNKKEGRIGVYDMVFGDKETFWLSWELVGDTDYAFHDGDAAVMGMVRAKAEAEDSLSLPIMNETRYNEQTDLNLQPQQQIFTICAPQLLHLGVDGRPLWFNGWLLPNKFSPNQNRRPTNFEAFIREPRTFEEGRSWKLEGNNICCLSADHVFNFTPAEKDTLDQTIKIAQRVGAISGK
ncbi:hypothetical protein N7478_003948 [Penicillium angulare]|uniref:uncharacterized protein n=1 Tax=Penicillium angulare TaxID=116970 RepID=UPI0025414840|nr:uncharacterized protein N7478_003948 [Penicillium angulare]KAJ5278576.1 hypothetical protein N7478_003948 [Penicillium angulare]